MPFTGKPEKHKQNHRLARKTNAHAAHIDGPNGKEPAVAIFRAGQIISLLPLTEALRLSNEIVDATEHHQEAQL